MELLRVEKATMDFGGVKAVNNVDLTVTEGEILGIIGPNGSGKTTLFNILTGIYRPTGGKFIFRGRDITGWPPHRIAQIGIARTFQNIRLFQNMSVLENVLLGEHTQLKSSLWKVILRASSQRQEEKEAVDRARELLSFVDLTEKSNEFAANLAYGEQRRLELARALASRPTLLLLDEPTAGMNPSEAATVMELIEKIRSLGITIVLIEHNMQVMMGIAERIIALDAGVKIAEGTPWEIQHDEKVIQAYLGEEE